MNESFVYLFSSNLGKNNDLKLLVDTGAGVNLIKSESLHPSVRIDQTKRKNLSGVFGSGKTIGTCRGLIGLGPNKVECEFDVVQDENNFFTDGIVGREFLKGRVILDCVNNKIEWHDHDTNQETKAVQNHNVIEQRFPAYSKTPQFSSVSAKRPDMSNEATDILNISGNYTDFAPSAQVFPRYSSKLEWLNTSNKPQFKIPNIDEELYPSKFQTPSKDLIDENYNKNNESLIWDDEHLTSGKISKTETEFQNSLHPDLENLDWNPFWNKQVKHVNGDVLHEDFSNDQPDINDYIKDKTEIKIDWPSATEEGNEIVFGTDSETLVVNKEKCGPLCKTDKHNDNMITINVVNPQLDQNSVSDNSVKKSRQEKLMEILEINKNIPGKDEFVNKIIMNHADNFNLPNETLSTTNLGQFTLPLKEGTGIINQKQYKLSIHHQEIGLKHIEELLKKDIIQYSMSPFNSPVIMVPKKGNDENGDKCFRMCVDFRTLNKALVPFSFPLPQIDDILQQLGGARYFTTLDLANGYHQVLISPEDRHKTAFSLGGGHFEFKRLPFGLATAPGFFQTLINSALANLNVDKVFAYIDDIVIASEDLESHYIKLRAVLNRLKTYSWKLNPEKCKFLQTRITFLGHICSKDGVEPNTSLVECIQNFPIPKNVKDVQSFLGLANYYRKYIMGHSIIAVPLTRLLKKDVKFEFDDKCYDAFNTLKKALSTKCVLAYPDFNKEFQICVDASGFGLGAILEQDGQPIAYGSKALNAAERRYGTIDRELLAIVWATKLWRCYLLGRHFTVFSDHKPLKGVIRVKDASSRLLRFHHKLSEFDYTIIHKSGKANTNADSLSRIVHSETSNRDISEETLNFDFDKRNVNDENDVKKSVNRLNSFCGAITRRQAKQQEQHEHEQNLTPENKLPKCKDVTPKLILEQLTNSDSKLIKNPLVTEPGLPNDTSKQQRDTGEEPKREIITLDNQEDINTVLHETHDSVFGGHFGFAKTYEQVKRKYFWKNMKKDIQDYIKRCDVCQRSKTCRQTKMPLMLTDLASTPFEKVYFDVVGPLPLSGPGEFRYILSMCDCLTRFVIFRPMQDQTAETIAKVMFEEIICSYTIPKILVTDNGTNFCSNLIKSLCKLMRIKKARTTAYHPASNVVERQHNTLGNYLRAFVDKHPMNWHSFLRTASFALNNTVNRTIGVTPMEMLFGFRSEIPSNLKTSTKTEFTYADYCDKLKYKLRLTWQEAKKHAEHSKNVAKAQHDKMVHPLEFHVGEQVLIRAPVRPNKLCDYWEGPYNIVNIHENHNVTILQKGKLKRVHMNRLKLYFPVIVGATSESHNKTVKSIQTNYRSLENGMKINLQPIDSSQVLE